MAEIKSFRAIKYTEKAGGAAVNACPPYDIINPEQRKQLVEKSEYNMVRLELPDGTSKYKKAASLLREWQKEGILSREEQEGIYVYREKFTVYGKEHTVTSLICLVKLYEFDEKVILPHEDTLRKAKTDRFNLMCETNCNFSPIYSMYMDEGGIVGGIINNNTLGQPDISFEDGEGVTHMLWKISDKGEIDKLTAAFGGKQLYIVDGHHRYETALNYKKHLETLEEDTDASGYVMMALANMEDPGLVVLPTHRVITGMKVDYDAFKAACSEDFDIQTFPDQQDIEKVLGENTHKHAFAVYNGGESFDLFVAKEHIGKTAIDGRSQAYSNLDVSILHSYILEKSLGIDKENMANQVNLRYIKSSREAVERVGKGEFALAVIMNPVKISQIKDVSLAGDKMPQKSTYFYPKLITGLVFNKLD